MNGTARAPHAVARFILCGRHTNTCHRPPLDRVFVSRLLDAYPRDQ